MHDSAESHARYTRLYQSWVANGVALPDDGPQDDRTVGEVLDLFTTYSLTRFDRLHAVDDRDPSSAKRIAERRAEHASNLKRALGAAERLHGTTPVESFGPRALKGIREVLIDAGHCRKTVNHDIRLLQSCFRWAASEELVQAATWQGISTVKALRQGESEAVEHAAVKPVDAADMVVTLAHVKQESVVAMVWLQVTTGMRPGEVVRLRGCDIDRTTDVWEFKPVSHKGSRRGHERVIPMGPLAQTYLQPWLSADPQAWCFPSAGDKTQPFCLRYYREVIQAAAKAAGVPHWHPHQLRHAAGTHFRRLFGLETAQTLLGHASLDMAAHYARQDHEAARDAARRI
jgi:integrase